MLWNYRSFTNQMRPLRLMISSLRGSIRKSDNTDFGLDLIRVRLSLHSGLISSIG